MKPARSHRSASSWSAVGLTFVSALVVGRLAWLAFAPGGPVSASPRVQPSAPVTLASRLSPEEYATLAAACPAALEALQAAEGVIQPAFHSSSGGTPLGAARRDEGIRLVQNESGLPTTDWLVQPEAWYAPEDEYQGGEPPPPAPPAPEEPPSPSTAQPHAEKPSTEKPRADAPGEPEPKEEQPRDPVMETPQREESEEREGGSPSDPAIEEAEKENTPPPKVKPQPEREPKVDPAPKPLRVKPAEKQPAAEEIPAGPALAFPSSPITPEPTAPARANFAPPPVKPRAGFAAPPLGVGALAPHAVKKDTVKTPQTAEEALRAHQELFAKNNYPSAAECAKCHQDIYDQWSISSHAYAFVSPMFHKFEQRINELSNGTVGYFCIRCHSPVGTAMCLPREMPLGQMPAVAREGITCIACHRITQRYAKTNGERRVEPADVFAPVYGGIPGDGVAEVLAKKADFKVKTSPEEKGAGQEIHTEGRFFEHLTQAEFCTACHQVAVHPGIKLEVVWEQYRASPACKKGVTCQECHMGRLPGVAGGYDLGAIAKINNKAVRTDRKLYNHIFYGPGYSIAHPGIFPQHAKANKWTFDEWLLFDWRAGWGTEEFEDAVEDGKIRVNFPAVWKESDDRYDARDIVADNLDRLKLKKKTRTQVMEAGSKVEGPYFACPPRVGQELNFSYLVSNISEGHNLPTASLGAQPQLWANVVLIGPTGQRLWETGYVDSYGDVCDIHSHDVRDGKAPFDYQLFNLQTMFLITGATGTDREFYLPVNLDIDQVAQLRPGGLPISVLNHPPFIRMESRSLAPLGTKEVKYKIPAELLCQPGRYRLSIRLRNRTEPMYFMRFCNSTPEMQQAMMEGMLDVHPQSFEFEIR